MEKAPVVVQRQGGAVQTAALLGIMSSIPFDWYMRRWVEMKLSFELLNPSPVPDLDVKSPLGARLVEVAARLAAVDERYSDWAAQVGVSVGSVSSEAEKEVSTTLENEADPTLENEATGSSGSSLPCLGF